MGSDTAKGIETLPRSFKMHTSMCMKLRNLVIRIMKIFPEIEEARPGSSSGIQTLCLLNNALVKAKLLLQYWSESSKLYMAITGETILSRSCRARNSLRQCLIDIQNMVPTILAVKISQIVQDLSSAVFTLDASEEEAGKAVGELMKRKVSSSVSMEEMKKFHFAASKLHLSTPEAIVMEKRSLTALLVKLGEGDTNKKNILRYLLHLLQKHEAFITQDQKENSSPCRKELSAVRSTRSSYESADFKEHNSLGHGSDQLGIATPPQEFICPLSHRVMYDPVVISSGHTFERMWIQKWFDEGNCTCPKTGEKLDNLLSYPNVGMKDMMMRWCSKYGISIEDPAAESLDMRQTDFSAISIASFGNSMCNLRLPSDISSISYGILDASFDNETTMYSSISNGPTFTPMTTIDDDDTSYGKVDKEPLYGLSELPWETQRQVVRDVRIRVDHDSQISRNISPRNFLEPLSAYMRNAREINCIQDIKDGLDLMLVFLTKNRRAIGSLEEEDLCLVSLFLDSECSKEALDILEVLSAGSHGQLNITLTRFVAPLLKIVESPNMILLHEQAIITLQNLSSDNNEICLEMVSLHFIQTLTHFLQQNILTRQSIAILKNLCNTENGRVGVAKTTGCLESISELLESDSHKEQEDAVCILLMLCVQKTEYCHLVMREAISIISSLVFVSNNGKDTARVRALELLRVLQDIKFGEEETDGYYEQQEQAVSPNVVRSASPEHTSSSSSSSSSSKKKPSRFRMKFTGFMKKR